MKRRRLAIAVAIALVGVGLFLVSWYSFNSFETLPKPSTITGSQAVDLTTCSGGYSKGTCSATTFEWSGSLVSDQGGTVSPITQVWGMPPPPPGNVPTTCGLHATYKTNIPLASQGPRYLPIGDGVTGEVISGSSIYVFTNGIYSNADGCAISSQVQPGNIPLPISLTYTSSSGQSAFNTSPYGYDFNPNNYDQGGMVAGLFILGLAWAVSVTGAAPETPGLTGEAAQEPPASSSDMPMPQQEINNEGKSADSGDEN